jgi:hypothetical protein
MARKRKGSESILARVSAGTGRSPLFRWMYENYDGLTAVAAANRLAWRALCKEFASAGLTDNEGKPPTVLTAKKTWQRVRGAVARARAERGTMDKKGSRGGGVPRGPADWRPEPMRVGDELMGRGMSTASPPGGGDTSHSQDAYEGLTPEEASRLSLLRARRQIAAVSGRDPNKVK